MLRQEIVRYNRLLAQVSSTLDDLQKTLAGTGTATAPADFSGTCDMLSNNTVPPAWAELAGFAAKPLSSWIAELQERLEAVRKWLVQGEPKNALYWLPGFMAPQSFLAALLLTHAHKHNTAVDKLAFLSRVLDRNPDALEDPPRVPLFVSRCRMEPTCSASPSKPPSGIPKTHSSLTLSEERFGHPSRRSGSCPPLIISHLRESSHVPYTKPLLVLVQTSQ